jgi:hypothetical protein
MKRQDNLFISKLVDKVLNETIEERANSLVSKLKHKEMKEGGSRIKGLINQMKGEVKERHGMDDAHPTLGPKRLKKDMSDDEIDNILNQLRMGDDDDFEDGVDEMPPFKRDRDYEDDDFDNELEENYDSEELQNHFDDEEYDEFNFEPMDDVRPNLRDLEGGTTHGREFMKDFEDKRDFIKKLRRGFRGEENEETLYEIEMEPKGEVCECGSRMYEGVCNECGSSSGMMDESEDIQVNETNTEGCKAVKEVIKSQNGDITELDQDLLERYGCGSLKESLIRRGLLSESLKGNQKKIDKNKNNKIDSEDFEILRRGKKTETKESLKGGQKKLDKNKNNKIDSEDFEMLRNGKKTKGKETVTVTESELIELIESMVNEELTVAGNKPKGLSEYEKAHKGSEKENKEYFKSLKKKMDDYLKDGSKGEYEENPKHFPKGNGQLAKMKAKKYDMSDDGKEFIDDYMRPGMENLDYDEVHPNEDWMTKNIEGSSETGNNPKWANAEETELGERLNKKRKANKLAKAKRQAYNKAPQPVVSDKTGDDKGTGIHIKVESTDKQTKVLNEEFDKIKNLMNYNRKTQ